MAKPPTQEFKRWFKEMADVLAPRLRTEVAEGRQIPPTVLVFGVKGEMNAFEVNLNTPRDKEATFYAMKTMAKRTDMVRAVVLLVETWVVKQQKEEGVPWEETAQRFKGKSLEHVPGRMEAVMLSALSDGMQLMTKAMIDRRNDLNVMAPFEHDQFTNYKGRLALDDEEE